MFSYRTFFPQQGAQGGPLLYLASGACALGTKITGTGRGWKCTSPGPRPWIQPRGSPCQGCFVGIISRFDSALQLKAKATILPPIPTLPCPANGIPSLPIKKWSGRNVIYFAKVGKHIRFSPSVSRERKMSNTALKHVLNVPSLDTVPACWFCHPHKCRNLGEKTCECTQFLVAHHPVWKKAGLPSLTL